VIMTQVSSAHLTVIGIVVLLSYDWSRDNDTGKQCTPDCDWNCHTTVVWRVTWQCHR